MSENYETEPYVLDSDGQQILLLDPASSWLRLGVIARALSRLPRYTSHTKGYFTYSVGQHSLGASYLVPPEFALEALMHDASEAYLNDMSTPVKRLCPEYKVLESRFDLAIRHRFGLPAEMSSCVHYADLIMLATEKRDLMPYDKAQWPILNGVLPMKKKIRPHWSWKWTEYLFLRRYKQLWQMSVSGL